MLLSIVIVNYNVKHFLAQTLNSVQKAIQNIETEVFVVDNNSVDGSTAVVQEKFPWVKLIASTENLGFSKGNNLAIRRALGEYVLLLNPDTVVEEDTFQKILDYLDKNPDVGALGVRMINGEGKFLPESKRSIPTPWVAFNKIFGLSKLFPKSKRFGKYHLTYLPENQTNDVEVLSGAFMMLRKKVLDEVGLLDEDYFMYGEDIDLSYRVLKAGYRVVYFADTRIIHYKGESTKKGSLNYVVVFYQAMLIFARKHFSGGRQSVFLGIIQTAVFIRAALAIFRRVISSIGLAVADFTGFLLIALLVKDIWEYFVHLPNGIPYPAVFSTIVAPLYAFIFTALLYLTGGYRRPYQLRSITFGVLLGFIGIATLSFLFPDINFSRGIVFFTAIGAFMSSSLFRMLDSYFRFGVPFFTEKVHQKVVLVGDAQEVQRVWQLLKYDIKYPADIIGWVHTESQTIPALEWLGNLAQLPEICRFYNLDDLIFCNKSLTAQQIMEWMQALAPMGVNYKIAPADGNYLIGPNIILMGNHSYEYFRINNQVISLQKKIFDLVAGLILLCLFPAIFWVFQSPQLALKQLFFTLIGRFHIVSFTNLNNPKLPKLKPGLLTPAAASSFPNRLTQQELDDLDLDYALHYSLGLDCRIFAKGFRHIGDRSVL